MATSIPHQDSDIARRAVRLVLDRYGPHLHRENNAAIFDLSLMGPSVLDHHAFHSGIDYSGDPLVSIDFIRERRMLGVAVARLVFWARHPSIDEADDAGARPLGEGLAELLTRRIVPVQNFAPKHQPFLDLIDDLLGEGAIAFDDILAFFFRGERGEQVLAPLDGGEPAASDEPDAAT